MDPADPLLPYAYLTLVAVNGLMGCATPIWPRMDKLAGPLALPIMITSPLILVWAVFWSPAFRPSLLVGAGAYCASGLVGLGVAAAMYLRGDRVEPEERVTLQALLERYGWYGPVFFVLSAVQVLGALAGIRWLAA